VADLISFARGAPSLDIVDVEGLKAAAVRAFERDPGGTTAYGTSVGYVPLREWIAAKHGVEVNQVLVTNGSMQADAFLFETVVQPGERERATPHPLELTSSSPGAAAATLRRRGTLECSPPR
jgi:2-aminoadipate transaminase